MQQGLEHHFTYAILACLCVTKSGIAELPGVLKPLLLMLVLQGGLAQQPASGAAAHGACPEDHKPTAAAQPT